MDEPEKCDYFDCPFCHWGCCTGDKDFAISMNLCQKEQEAEVDLEPETITVVEAVDDYKCERPDDVVRLEECSTCTGRQPNVRCPYMKIETVYRRKTNG